MKTLKEIREKYPQYKDIGDDDLISRLHEKHYKDIPLEKFKEKINAKESMSALESAMNWLGKEKPISGLAIGAGEAAYNLPMNIYNTLNNLTGKNLPEAQTRKSRDDIYSKVGGGAVDIASMMAGGAGIANLATKGLTSLGKAAPSTEKVTSLLTGAAAPASFGQKAGVGAVTAGGRVGEAGLLSGLVSPENPLGAAGEAMGWQALFEGGLGGAKGVTEMFRAIPAKEYVNKVMEEMSGHMNLSKNKAERLLGSAESMAGDAEMPIFDKAKYDESMKIKRKADLSALKVGELEEKAELADIRMRDADVEKYAIQSRIKQKESKDLREKADRLLEESNYEKSGGINLSNFQDSLKESIPYFDKELKSLYQNFMKNANYKNAFALQSDLGKKVRGNKGLDFESRNEARTLNDSRQALLADMETLLLKDNPKAAAALKEGRNIYATEYKPYADFQELKLFQEGRTGPGTPGGDYDIFELQKMLKDQYLAKEGGRSVVPKGHFMEEELVKVNDRAAASEAALAANLAYWPFKGLQKWGIDAFSASSNPKLVGPAKGLKTGVEKYSPATSAYMGSE